jgi:hypothetical protein
MLAASMPARTSAPLGAVLCLALASIAHAAVDRPVVDTADSRGAVRLVTAGKAATIVFDADADPGVRRAAGDLAEDVFRVTGVRAALSAKGPALPTKDDAGSDIVIVGVAGRSALLDRLAKSGRIDLAPLRGTWEASTTTVVMKPWAGVARAIVIAGSDKRGAIYGVYDLSEAMGVSPWYWWADVPVRHKEALFVRAGRYGRPSPAIKYRGIFLNDEAPALSGWAFEKFGGFNSRMYAHVFELVLRLKGNFLWPAMWGRAFNADDPENPRLANEYGIVMGTSHHEPLMRAQAEWRGKGEWNYDTNGAVLREFWAQSLDRTKGFENLQTVGMRGDGDAPMSREANVALLERIVADQRRLIAEHLNPDVTRVPQVWALYKEVQEYYEKGMRVPDDVTLLWSDDNWGNIRRLPTADERGRAGGAGVYYHFDYVGGPRNYKWLNTVPLPKVWEQMHLAYAYGATRLWIVNVGDLKPMEVPIQFFLDYAWDPPALPIGKLADYQRAWAAREFGEAEAAEIARLVAGYAKINSRRKPEMLEPKTYSLVNYREAERVVEEYRDLVTRAEAVATRLPAEAQDAYFQLVLYPIKASAVVQELWITTGFNNLYAVQGRAATNAMADKARALFAEDAALTARYHALNGGKWNRMMSQVRIGYTYWQQPPVNAMPGVQQVQPLAGKAVGVAIEGSEGAWPDGPGRPTLPSLNALDRAPRYIDLFNRGSEPAPFSIATSAPWLTVDAAQGELTTDRRVWVSASWADVPAGTQTATVTVASGNTKVDIQVSVLGADVFGNPGDGYVDTNGYVSIDPTRWTAVTATAGRHWQVLPDHGRTGSAITAFPVIGWPASASTTPDMHVDYAATLKKAGDVKVLLHLAPTQKFQPGAGLRVGVSFDDQPPQVLNLHADESNRAWERSVGDGVTVLTSTHAIASPGRHVLKVWAIDPGVVVQKILLDTGGLRPSYLGPPESYRVTTPAAPATSAQARR